MKTKTIIISVITLLSLSIILSSYITKETKVQERTEEYAIIDVTEKGKRKFIRVTKGVELAAESEIKKEKTDDYDDFSPIIKELNKLNEEGFELLNASLAYSVSGGGSNMQNYSVPRYTFMMVKKNK